MLVEEIMKKNVITLAANSTIKDAMETLHQHRIRHLPIINKELRVIGIVSDRDIRDASPSIFHTGDSDNYLLRPLKAIMKENVITAHPLDFVQDISNVFF